MKRILYLIRCAFSGSLGKMLKTVRQTAKESKRLSVVIFFDMIFCAAKYGAGYTDYKTFNFAKMPAKRRKTFVTRGYNNELIRRLNNPNDYDKFENKVKFNKTFKDFVKRDWIYLKEVTKENFAEFVKNKDFIMAKPVDGLCGAGVQKINCKDVNPHEVYNQLITNNQLLVEEYITQHPQMAKFCETSVNTVRITTVTTNGKVHMMFAGLRTGSGGRAVDNFHFGGMIAVIAENGEIITDAVNEQNQIFSAHPDSGQVFKGTKIPLFDQALEMVKSAATLVPGIRYVGWDVAITENHPLLIEANHNPAYDFFQTRAYMQAHENGLKPRFEEIINI